MTNEWSRKIPLSKDPAMNDYKELKEATNYYLMEGNVDALLRISYYSQLIVAKAISEGAFTPRFISVLEKDPEKAVKLYRQIRWKLNKRARRMFRQFVTKTIINTAIRKYRGNLTENRISDSIYEPGMDFDVEKSVYRVMDSGRKLDGITYEDIVGLDRRKGDHSIVVVIDSSGSMSGHKILSAATMAAIISHKARRGKYSVIGFNSEAFIIKKACESREPLEVVEKIVDLVPLGYTNIADGLYLALEESKYMKKPRFILITDGEYNAGEDPRHVASKIKELHVVYVGRRKSSKGASFCKTLANLGDGRFHELRNHKDIPRLVRRILS